MLLLPLLMHYLLLLLPLLLLLLQLLLHLPQHVVHQLHVSTQPHQQGTCRHGQLRHCLQHTRRHPCWHLLVLLLLQLLLVYRLPAGWVCHCRLQQLLELLVGRC